MATKLEKTNTRGAVADKLRRATSVAHTTDIDDADVVMIDPKKIAKEMDYWHKPDILAFVDWITDPKLYARFKDPRGVAGKSKNEVFKEIATYINATTKPIRPMDYNSAKSRFQVIKGKYDKARELMNIPGPGGTEDAAVLMDRARTVCPHFDRLYAVLESDPSMDGLETGPSSRKRTVSPSEEPNYMDDGDEGSLYEERVNAGRRKRSKNETPAPVTFDPSALQNQTGALQEGAMDVPNPEERYLPEQGQEWEWGQGQEQAQEQGREWEQEREREHSYKLLRAEAEADALLQQRRMDLETYYQHRAKAIEFSLKERSERMEEEFRERCRRMDEEHQRRLDDFREERRLFLEQQRRFDEFRTSLECRLASQWNIGPASQPARTYTAYHRPHQPRDERFE
ncbi:hypothetical protein EMPS_03915 [Entomortierella parvispora]|uniref:Uncharacterized protein n=1 Tax=Entomortierella parvispora TaxID=205924 RepID=A0A9P3H7L4_9FUNG|nr:hypothetical protein EMPS_03915 [Entomortierella parvispora]